MRYREIITETVDRLQMLLDFMLRVKAGDKSGDISQRNQITKTSHNLEVVSTQVETGWLCHFTENPDDLGAGMSGVSDHRLLGQTRGIGERSTEGFNYAFPVPSREASYEQSRYQTSGMSPYGSHAFIFKARYIRVFHKGDRQVQAIFLSKDFNPSQTIRLSSATNDRQYAARRKLSAYENQSVGSYINGVFVPTPADKVITLTPDEIRDLGRIAKEPAIIWKVENGPQAGLAGSWAKIIKKLIG